MGTEWDGGGVRVGRTKTQELVSLYLCPPSLPICLLPHPSDKVRALQKHFAKSIEGQ